LSRHRRMKTGREQAEVKTAAQSREKEIIRLESKINFRTVLAIMALAAILYTWPLIFALGGRILGRFSNYYGDVFSGIWELWITQFTLLKQGSNPFVIGMLAGPYAGFYYSVLAFHKYLLVMVPFTALFGPVASFNLYALGNFILAGFFTYLLALELTGRRMAAVFAGLAFAFCPYAYAHAVVHMDLAATWPLPLVLWALLVLDTRRDLRSLGLLILALLFFHLYCSIYYYLFIPLAGCSYLAVQFINHFFYDFKTSRKVKGAWAGVSTVRWIIAAACIVLLVAGGILVYEIYLGPMAGQLVRPIHWQERFKLSWANYLLPGVDHPWFGKLTGKVVPIRRNVIESTAYVGWVPLLLALWGWRAARRDWRAWFLAILGLAAISFTLGPYLSLGAVNLPLPSLALHKIAPFIRVISRYAIFAELSVAALAGYGMVELLRRFQARWSWAISLALIIMAVEFLHPAGTTKVATRPDEAPPLYAYLAGIKEEVTVFEYPPVASTGNALSSYLYFQTIHQKKLFNRHLDTTTIPPEYLPLWRDLDYPGALYDPNNVSSLKYFGVDYVAFHDLTGTEVQSLPEADLSRVEGLELVQEFGKDVLYRVTARPASVLLSFATRPYYNYLETETEAGEYEFEPSVVMGAGKDLWGWRVMHEKGKVVLRNLLDTPQKVNLSLMAVAFMKPKALEVESGGNPACRAALETRPQEVLLGPFELPAKGELELVFRCPEGQSEMRAPNGRILLASIALARVKVIQAQ